GTFSETKRQVGLLRMLQAGVIVSDYATLMVEILKDNARPEAGAVYGASTCPGPSSWGRSRTRTASKAVRGRKSGCGTQRRHRQPRTVSAAQKLRAKTAERSHPNQ